MKKKKSRKAVVMAPKVCERRANLTELEVARIMVETECARQTVWNWVLGRSVKTSTGARIVKAALKLGIEVRA